MRNILLIEPNYKNKYPPIGLMKLATYHRKLGDNVFFFKGDLKELIINDLTDDLIDSLYKIREDVEWRTYQIEFKKFIKTGKRSIIDELKEKSEFDDIAILGWLEHYNNSYRKKGYIEKPKWDRICISTLFTFYWKISIETIQFAKNLVKDIREIWVGGVLATVLADEVKKETGVTIHKGLLDKPGILDDNEIIIDELPLDYSILDEIDYKYSENNAYYGYMTRGCIRKCPFCAVWKIEPEFNHYISLKDKIDETKEIYGERRNLLLLDNNVLASEEFPKIINEIKECGFVKGSRFVEPNRLEIAIKNLRNRLNEEAQIKKIDNLLSSVLNKSKDNECQNLYDILDKRKLLSFKNLTKENLLQVYPDIKELYEKLRPKTSGLRHVDFNQGIDARLLDEEKIKLLSEIPIKPLRIAFDRMEYEEVYTKAIELAAHYKIKNFSNYLLYNERDKPKELYQRLEINILLSEELNINIYSFPMKFHPITFNDGLSRDFLGKHWYRKYIRAIQTILNATKGKVGKGKNFFYKAFGKDLKEFEKILLMPEPYILYRLFFEELGYTEKWWDGFNNFGLKDKKILTKLIKQNEFKNFDRVGNEKPIIDFIKEHYLITRADVEDPNSKLYKEKQEYDLKNKRLVHLRA